MALGGEAAESPDFSSDPCIYESKNCELDGMI